VNILDAGTVRRSIERGTLGLFAPKIAPENSPALTEAQFKSWNAITSGPCSTSSLG